MSVFIILLNEFFPFSDIICLHIGDLFDVFHCHLTWWEKTNGMGGGQLTHFSHVTRTNSERLMYPGIHTSNHWSPRVVVNNKELPYPMFLKGTWECFFQNCHQILAIQPLRHCKPIHFHGNLLACFAYSIDNFSKVIFLDHLTSNLRWNINIWVQLFKTNVS